MPTLLRARSTTAHPSTVTALVLALLLVLLLAPAGASASHYVSLGDSFSSGQGTRNYYNAGCQRSHSAFPALVNSTYNFQYIRRDCSGAETWDVRRDGGQVESLSSGTRLVTITIGGNDAQFRSVLTSCALWGDSWNCDGAIERARGVIRDVLPGRLARTYSKIRERARWAHVVVLGYPRMFSSRWCGGTGGIRLHQRRNLNLLADELVAVTSRQAWNAGFAFRDVRGDFANHWVCSDVEYLNGVSRPLSESFHPNWLGHRNAYFPHVRDEIARRGIRGH